MSSDPLFYTPSEPLGEVKKGDQVEFRDRDQKSWGEPLTIVHVGKRHVRTADGRRWTKDYGEWIAAFHGGQPESYPFPSIARLSGQAPAPAGST
jgi:hypothetical protein